MRTNIYLQDLLKLENPKSELFADSKNKVLVKLTDVPNENQGNTYKYSWKDLLTYCKNFNFKEYVEVWTDRKGKMPQGAQIMKDADYVLFFIPERRDQARFVSVYRIDKSKYRRDNDKSYFDLKELEGFDNLKERIVVSWKGDIKVARHWYQDEKKKTLAQHMVLLIDQDVRKDIKRFDSYTDVILSYDELCTVINDEEWQEKLKLVNCIYSIVDTREGKQYIGQTSNSDGILGRWKQYADTVHGNDTELKKLGTNIIKQFFQWTILETLPLLKNNDDVDVKNRINEREQFYKRKFCTSTKKSDGYNPN